MQYANAMNILSCGNVSMNAFNTIQNVLYFRRQLKREHCKMFIKYNCIQDHEANRVYFVKVSNCTEFSILL